MESGGRRADREGIQEVISDYFEDLFKASRTAGELNEREKVPCVTDEQNRELEKPITREEVKEAVFAMYPDKSPGHDGLNPGFYQAYWEIIGEDVVKFCQEFFDTGELPVGVNSTLVCLIPKIKQPREMTDVRPISLCNVLFRVLSKVLANRLKICLPSIISDKTTILERRIRGKVV